MRNRGTALRKRSCRAATPAQDDPSTGSGRAELAEKPPLPAFEPVPRRYRHDGWTPERQKAFIEALADCGCVTRAAAMVNMAQANCYTLRRAPGAEGFRKAWDAALDFGLARLKDIAFERAIEGQLHPVIRGGKLVGFHRKTNDALLMFCLRHYGKDAHGKRTTINYFSTRAVAGAGVASGRCASGTASLPAGSARADVGNDLSPAHPEPVSLRDSSASEGQAVSEASTTTVRTVINGPSAGSGRAEEEAAATLSAFEGMPLDAEAHAAIAAALEACAARARAACDAVGEEAADFAADDPGEPFVPLLPGGSEFRGTFEPPVAVSEWAPFAPGEGPWEMTGAALPDWAPPDPAADPLVADPAAPEARAGKAHEERGEGVEREGE